MSNDTNSEEKALQSAEDAPQEDISAEAKLEEEGRPKTAEELQSENAALRDRLLRVMAEMENLRRRTEREKAEIAKYAIANFARDVLGVGDNIKRAIESVSAPEEDAELDPALKGLLEGVEMTERELGNMLERHGITTIDPKGKPFDPNHHQAMFETENTDVPTGTCIEVVQLGFMIGERVLRPALVGVSKGGPKVQKPAEEGEAAEGGEKQPEGAEAQQQTMSPSAEAQALDTSSEQSEEESAGENGVMGGKDEPIDATKVGEAEKMGSQVDKSA